MIYVSLGHSSDVCALAQISPDRRQTITVICVSPGHQFPRDSCTHIIVGYMYMACTALELTTNRSVFYSSYFLNNSDKRQYITIHMI